MLDSFVTWLTINSNKVCLEFHYFWWCKSHLCQRGKCAAAACDGYGFRARDNPSATKI